MYPTEEEKMFVPTIDPPPEWCGTWTSVPDRLDNIEKKLDQLLSLLSAGQKPELAATSGLTPLREYQIRQMAHDRIPKRRK
jgi:hypothetical protein